MDARQQQDPSARHRLDTIEGLRGYLALWVVVCHVLWAAGIPLDDRLWGVLRVLRDGAFAVDIFVIVSGFVIFLLLDTQKATYQQFVLRRYFRLFPLFIALFIVSIPISRLSMWNASHAAQYLTPEQAIVLGETMTSWWQNLYTHIPLHLLLLHGTVPESFLADAPGAFLIPAWSVSLEWQFYLLAPLAYKMATSSSRFVQLALLGICALMYVGARSFAPGVNYGAALPFHIEYFVLGGASYFLYKRRSRMEQPNAWFVLTGSISAILLATHGPSWAIPIGLWFAFLGVILEQPSSLTSRATSLIFTNALSQHLGKISYSIYLSHILVITFMQYVLLAWLPDLSLAGHIFVLLSLTVTVTIALSTALHRCVEAPGIAWGRSVARSIATPRRSDRGVLPETSAAIERVG
jgi:peptidoglycan/LPS O-acetylase OafA/YrhL